MKETQLIIKKINSSIYMPAGFAYVKNHPNRPAWALVFQKSAQSVYNFNEFGKKTVNPGEMLILPKGCSYKVNNTQDGEIFAVNFSVSESSVTQPLIVKTTERKNTENIFKMLIREKYDSNMALSYLYTLLSIFFNDKERNSPNRTLYAKIEKAVDKINETMFSEQPQIEELAELCNMSPVYFRTLFRKCFAMNPSEYIQMKRIEKAQNLLSQTNLSLSETASLCGFSDSAHMCRIFKSKAHCTPGEYRRRNSI